MGEIGLVNSNDGVLERVVRRSTSPPPDPTLFSEESLSAAEEVAEQVVNCIHPTLDSEETRRDVIDYIQRLIKTYVDCELFPYGSVPLKTYLPDGDIDFTALKGCNPDESLPHKVLAIFQAEEQNENAEYQIRDTQFIDAEVKLVKCFVRDIIIDISFNQLGGLSTLCFLEKIDRLVGKNHLFKRSIILVKAWCYFESRILGAHHGLLSTYALETLVLYIFHVFHTTLRGPLAVLYKFLEYYSQFDWENYCISLKGPVRKSLLPNIVVKMPENGGNDLMLSEEFLESCMEMFSVSSRELEEKPKAFQAKHLNIIDPLKENNNLGRSVHRGNFYRIRSAFKYGARKLGQILLQPRDKVFDEVNDFFGNTLASHGHRIRRMALEFGDEESLEPSLSSPRDLFSEVESLLKSSISDLDNDELDKYSIREISLEMASNSSLRNGTSAYTISSNGSASLSINHCHKLPNFSSKSSAENGSLEKGNSHQNEKFGSSSWLENREKNGEMNPTYQWCIDNSNAVSIAGSCSSTPKANNLESQSFDFREMDIKSAGEPEDFNPLADLSGDYESHIRSLLYGQFCHGFSTSAPKVNNPPSLPSKIQYKTPWDIVRQSIPLGQNQFSQTNPYPVSLDQSVYDVANSALPSTNAFHSEWKGKTRGTGTYFPHVNGFQKDRLPQGRIRNSETDNQYQFRRYGRRNGLYPSTREPNYLKNDTREVLHPNGRSEGKWRPDIRGQSTHSIRNENQTNGTCRIEFGSVGNLAEEVISGPSTVSGSTVLKNERAPMRLKNEDEFPPLCH
ncbi:hypothetical protein ACJIZ3_017828 [Penstemon smallii]|uniref:Uncharacterized protein n=1 Tax=Penstemon smallii TaxID=265156 RepID=A0ABD3SWM9_9LAMI